MTNRTCVMVWAFLLTWLCTIGYSQAKLEKKMTIRWTWGYFGSCGGGDTSGNEEVTIVVRPATASQPVCMHITADGSGSRDDLDYEWEFTGPASSPGWDVTAEFWESNLDYPTCVYEGSDIDAYGKKTFHLLANEDSMDPQTHSEDYHFWSQQNDDCDCKVRLSMSWRYVGEPYITGKQILISQSPPYLSLQLLGFNFNPDAIVKPSALLSSSTFPTDCVTPYRTVTDREFKCDLTAPGDLLKTKNVNLDVTYQTAEGSKSTTVSFPTCQHSPCTSKGDCTYDPFEIPPTYECVCTDINKDYGDSCELTYPPGTPVLREITPLGGDYNLQIDVTVIGLLRPSPSDVVDHVYCEISWDDQYKVEDSHADMVSTPIATVALQNHQSGDTSKGLCSFSSGSIPAPPAQVNHANIRIVWARDNTDDDPTSFKKPFRVYGAFDRTKSQMTVNTNNSKIVLEPQFLRIYSWDGEGRNRIGGGDQDRFILAWKTGNTVSPEAGIRIDSYYFVDSPCKRKADNPNWDCAYYEMGIIFDFSGVFTMVIYTQDQTTGEIFKIGDEQTFKIAGLGEATLAVPDPVPSGIDWANSLDREAIDLFDLGLAQKLSPNTGRADRPDILAPLFQKWSGGWFSQRETVSLSFESNTAAFTSGTVHVLRPQGLDDAEYCTTHTDKLDSGSAWTKLAPWNSMGELGGKTVFEMTRDEMAEGLCIEDAKLVVRFIHRDIPSIGVKLARVGLPDSDPFSQVTTEEFVYKVAAPPGTPGAVQDEVRTYDLTEFWGRPAQGKWKLTVESPTGRGHLRSWHVDVQLISCLRSSRVDQTVCGSGPGTKFDRATGETNEVVVKCPSGGVIKEIVLARYGNIDGVCKDSLTVYDACEADPALVKKKVEGICVGLAECRLQASDVEFRPSDQTIFYCPGALPPCTDDDTAASDKRAIALARREISRSIAPRSSVYTGTEDSYLKTTFQRNPVSNVGVPLYSKRQTTTCDSSIQPKRALIIKAACIDPNEALIQDETAASRASDSLYVKSTSGDFDLDWHEEELILWGFRGSGLNARIKYAPAMEPRYSVVMRNLGIGGQAQKIGSRIKTAVGDFDRDAYSEVLIAYVDNDSKDLKMFIWDLKINNALWGGLQKTSANSKIACGCWDNTAQLTSTFTGTSFIDLGLNKPNFMSFQNGAEDNAFAISAGDIGMKAIDDVALAYISEKNKVIVKILRYDGANLIVVSTTHIAVTNPHSVSVVLGNFEGNGYADLAIAIAVDKEILLQLYDVNEFDVAYPIGKLVKELTPWTNTQTLLWRQGAPYYKQFNIQMVRGDLDQDGDDEVVVGYSTPTFAAVRRIDTIGIGEKCRKLSCFALVGDAHTRFPLGPSDPTILNRSPELHLDIGNIDETYPNELVVAVEYHSSDVSLLVKKVQLMAFAATEFTNQPFRLLGRHCYLGPYYQTNEATETKTINNFALSVGNLFARGLRVGEPMKIRYEGVPTLLMVLSAPPTHMDYLISFGENIRKSVVVNPGTLSGSGSFTGVSQHEGIVTSMDYTFESGDGTTSSHTIDFSTKLGPVFGGVSKTWEDSSSDSKNTGTARITQIATSRDLTAGSDDAILFLSTDRDIWKYPIVDQDSAILGTLDITWSSSCGDNCVQRVDGRDLWWYTPDHEVFNLLTYSPRAPIDFVPSKRIFVGEKMTLGTNAIETWIDQQTGQSENVATVHDESDGDSVGGSAGASINLEWTFAASPLGVGFQQKLGALGLEFKLGYGGKTDSKTQSTRASKNSANINRDMSVHCYMEAIHPNYAYRVQPFVYMASSGGREYIKVAYSAEPAFIPGVTNWWYTYYSKPDPSFNMPWFFAQVSQERQLRTKDIVSVPPYPALGQIVEIAVKVKNKALVDARDVPVSLWKGDPDNCLDLKCALFGSLIGSQKVNVIPAQGSRVIYFRMLYDGINNIYATVDDANVLAEVHDENNKAYNLIFLNIRDDGYLMQNMKVEPLLTFEPEYEDGKVAGYYISATIIGDTFTRRNVMVQFWRRAIGTTGTLIGAVSMPKVKGSSTRTYRHDVTVYWETKGLYGPEPIFVDIVHTGSTFLLEENIVSWHRQTLNVACFGTVDVCGVCNGDGGTCKGCDGVPNSGKVFDYCGKCGGDGSTCCIPDAPASEKHIISIASSGTNSNPIIRVSVGDYVIWENHHGAWQLQVWGGFYDFYSATAYDLAAFQTSGVSSAPPPLTSVVTQEGLDKAMDPMGKSSIGWKNLEEGPLSTDGTPITQMSNPSISPMINKRFGGGVTIEQLHDLDALTRSLFGENARLHYAHRRNINKRSADPFSEDNVYTTDGNNSPTIDNEKEFDERKDPEGPALCCTDAKGKVPEKPKLQRQNAKIFDRRRRSSPDVGTPPETAAPEAASHAAKSSSGTEQAFHIPSRSFKSVVMEILELRAHVEDQLAQLEQQDRYDEAEDLRASLPDWFLAENWADYDHQLSKRAEDGKNTGCLCGGDSGVIAAGSVGAGVSQDGTKAFGVQTFSGFGAGRSFSLYDWTNALKTPYYDIMGVFSGRMSAPHRLMTPGIYPWYDHAHPVLYGTIIVDYSTKQLDKCGICGGDNSKCTDCKGVLNGPAIIDECGRCVIPSSDPGTTVKDCAGVCFGTALKDECGDCVGGSTGKSFNYRKDCNNVCGGSAQVLCGFCGADPNTPGLLDCGGDCFGNKTINKCGICVGGDSGLDLLYGMDCAGVCGGNKVRDCRGICSGTAKTDCAGTCAGSAKINQCGVCIGGTTGLDEPNVRTCDGKCAWREQDRCKPRTRQFVDRACEGVVDCFGTCDGTGVTDKIGVCCLPAAMDCAGLCGGSATVDECLICSGGSTGHDPIESEDCLGECNGTAVWNPCGICVAAADYSEGPGYTVDCANTCNGSAWLDECDMCVEGSTGNTPGQLKDCQGVCNGSAIQDGCGVCYLPGVSNHTHNQDMDCNGKCNSTLLPFIDECGRCSGGDTGREPNSDKDCAGQCFGSHTMSDPACQCAGTLDACFVCDGDNTSCAGCDGVPWSGKKKDNCGVCDGDDTYCCFAAKAMIILIDDFKAITNRKSAETGEPILLKNSQAQHDMSIVQERLDLSDDYLRLYGIPRSIMIGTITAGSYRTITINTTGVYRLSAVNYPLVTVELTIEYNRKMLDDCGRCVFKEDFNDTRYATCCAVNPGLVPTQWDQYLYDGDFDYHNASMYNLTLPPDGVERNKLPGLTYTISIKDVSVYSPFKDSESILVKLGDKLRWENRDSFDHVLSFYGPVPLADVLMEAGTTFTMEEFLVPGQYRFISNKNIVGGLVTVVLDLECVTQPVLGCDGEPWSFIRYDDCGVCGGNGSTCCLYGDSLALVVENYKFIALRNTVYTGEPIVISNSLELDPVDLFMDRTDLTPEEAKQKRIRTYWELGSLRVDTSLTITIADPGTYKIYSLNYRLASIELTVSFNPKILDTCEQCVHPAALLEEDYKVCCAMNPFKDPSNWVQYYTNITIDTDFIISHNFSIGAHINRTGQYLPNSDVDLHLDAIIHSVVIQGFTLESSLDFDFEADVGYSFSVPVGDRIEWENKDGVVILLSFTGPAPIPDLVFEPGSKHISRRMMVPGVYSFTSNKNLIKGFITVAVNVPCLVEAPSGCDNVPWSTVIFDRCGVCNGNGLSCCVADSEMVLVVQESKLLNGPLEYYADTGEPVTIINRELSPVVIVADSITVTDSADLKRVKRPYITTIPPLDSRQIQFDLPGNYSLRMADDQSAAFRIVVSWNTKTLDYCQRCRASWIDVDTVNYTACCLVHPGRDPTNWFQYWTRDKFVDGFPIAEPFNLIVPPKLLYDDSKPTLPIVNQTHHLAIQELRLLVDRPAAGYSRSSPEITIVDNVSYNIRLRIGDRISWANRDLLDYVLSFEGPSPVDDIYLPLGGSQVMERLLVPGVYTFRSNRNLIQGSLLVHSPVECLVRISAGTALRVPFWVSLFF